MAERDVPAPSAQETNVVPLRVALPPDDGGRRRIRVKRPAWDECRHRSVQVDEKHRLLTCTRCERQVDPIYWLVQWAHEDRRVDERVERIKEFEEKERRAAQQKKDDCKAARHPIHRNRNHCRCGALTRWQMENDPEAVRKAMPAAALGSLESGASPALPHPHESGA